MYSYANGTHLVSLWFRINVDLGCNEILDHKTSKIASNTKYTYSCNEPYLLSHKFYMEENNFILETPV